MFDLRKGVHKQCDDSTASKSVFAEFLGCVLKVLF